MEENVKYGISICVTAYKADKYIEEMLDSAMKQTWFTNHDNWEIIVGIDGCYRTLKKVQSIMAKYRNLRVLMMDCNRGTYVTSNTIMKAAKYNYLLRFDSDDIMNPNMIEVLMKNRQQGDIVSYNLQNFGISKNIESACGQIFMSREIFEKFGGFRDWPCAADAEFRRRVKFVTRECVLKDVLMKRRTHNQSLTRKKGALQCVGKRGNIREKYAAFMREENIKNAKDAIIACATNTYKEIHPDTDISAYAEKIIVTMTSWTKRINNVPYVVKDMLVQTKKPNIININLSIEEFPEKEKSLPESLTSIVDGKQVQINWIEGRNRRQWKKIIPTFEKYPKDIIVCVDDDRRYPTNFIESLYKSFMENNELHPITVNYFYKVNGMVQHCGHGTMEKLSHYGDMLSLLDEEIFSKESSDTFFTYMANRAGHPLIPVNSTLNKSIKLFNEIEPLHKTNGTYSASAHKEMIKFLDGHLGKAPAVTAENAPLKTAAPAPKKKGRLTPSISVSVKKNLPPLNNNQEPIISFGGPSTPSSRKYVKPQIPPTAKIDRGEPSSREMKSFFGLD